MKKFKELVAEIYDYPPTTKDEKEFINMHTIKTFDYPVKNEHGLPFRDDRIKPPGPQHKKLATYEPPKEPTTVYTKANEEVEIDEGVDLKNVPTHKLQAMWDKHKDEERPTPAFAAHLKRINTELVSRKKKGMKEEAEQVDEIAKGGYGVGWMLKTDPKLGAKVKQNVDAHKAKVAAMGKPSAGVSVKKEEVEQVDEISKDLASSYKEKALTSKSQAITNKDPKTLLKRIDGIKNASSKLGQQTGSNRGGYGKSAAVFQKAKVPATEEVDLEERKLPSMTIHITPASYGKHEVLDMSHDVEAKHPKTGEDLEPGHSLSADDVSKLKRQGHNVEITEETVSEKTLTPAEMKKREEVAKAIERENPKMPMGMKMAIATKTAKRVAEEVSELKNLLGINTETEDLNESFELDDMLSLLAVVSDTDNSVEVFFEDSEEGLIIDKEVADMLLAVYEHLDEEGQDKFEYALTLSNESFDYCVDFCSQVLSEDSDEHN